MKLTKEDIEQLAQDIIDYCVFHEYGDTSIYYNDKRVRICYDFNNEDTCVVVKPAEEDICPLDYFEYANYRHILSMSFEGGLYDLVNYGNPENFLKIFNKYSLYYELGNAWNLTAIPNYGTEDDEIEYTDYTDRIKPDPIYIGYRAVATPMRIIPITVEWYRRSKETGDKGGCVVGAGFDFVYEKRPYHMFPCSPYQGENSWTPHIEWVKEQLTSIGATDIVWNYGILD